MTDQPPVWCPNHEQPHEVTDEYPDEDACYACAVCVPHSVCTRSAA